MSIENLQYNPHVEQGLDELQLTFMEAKASMKVEVVKQKGFKKTPITGAVVNDRTVVASWRRDADHYILVTIDEM